MITNVSIEFAEWLFDNEWAKQKFTTNKVVQYYSHKHCEQKTIEQLYEIFLRTKINKETLNFNDPLFGC